MGNVDFISGFSETINDGSPIWAIADTCEKILGDAASVGRYAYLDNLSRIGKREEPGGAVIYSYGAANFFKQLKNWRFKWVVGIVAVNRIWDGQKWEECFEVPESDVDSAVFFNTVYRGAVPNRMPVLPECCPIRNPSAKFVNFNCFWDGVDHCNIVSLPVVRETIFDLVHRLKG